MRGLRLRPRFILLKPVVLFLFRVFETRNPARETTQVGCIMLYDVSCSLWAALALGCGLLFVLGLETWNLACRACTRMMRYVA